MDTSVYNMEMSEGKRNLNYIVRIGLVAIVYFIAARFGLLLQLGYTNATPVWPPSGIAFAVMLLFGSELWPGITIGAFAVNLLVFYENKTTGLTTSIIASSIICTGNTLEALAGYYLLKRMNAMRVINKARDFAFFFVVALVMCIVSATIGASGLLLNKIITLQQCGVVWFTWWMGDVSGVIVLTPALLSLGSVRKIERFIASRAIQVVLLFFALGTYLAVVFLGLLPLGLNKAKIFFIFFILIWCAFRMNQWQSSLVVLFLASFSIWSTLHQKGPFLEPTQNESLLSLQVFLCISSVTMMFLSTTLHERRRVENSLMEANASLENRVVERTKDIEKQKEELREMNEQLIIKTEELQKANADSRFFAHIISHDLREPLRTIAGFLQLLEERYANRLDAEAEEFIQQAVKGAKRMHVLIDDMLAYSRVEHSIADFNEVDINETLAIVTDNLKTMITESKATIKYNRLPLIKADAGQMVQLFQNLVDNAIKYKGKGLPVINIEVNRLNEEWVFAISDNGIGVDGKQLERIFVIFQRLHTRDKYEGTGVGLAICKKIVERHAGKIWAENNPLGGTVIRFTLPA